MEGKFGRKMSCPLIIRVIEHFFSFRKCTMQIMNRFLLISFCFPSREGRVGRWHIFVGFSLVFEFHMEGWPSAKHKIRWFCQKHFVFDIWGQRRRIHTKLNENFMQRTLNFNKMHFEAWSISPTISIFSTAGTADISRPGCPRRQCKIFQLRRFFFNSICVILCKLCYFTHSV